MKRNADGQYLSLLQDVIDNGAWKNTRSGRVKSVFGRTARFDLQDGLPLLTTKKVFTKGVIHELLWFLSGNTNIKYLVDNNVHIWDSDAYRWFKTLNFKYLKREDSYYDEEDNKVRINVHGFYKLDHCIFDLEENIEVAYAIVVDNNTAEEKPVTSEELSAISKEQFVEYVKQGAWIHRYDIFEGRKVSDTKVYVFGDLGEIYGKQWRSYGISGKDQIQNIIDTLKTNPDDRRMILTAWNPDVLEDIALPACHMFASFWTKELTTSERMRLWNKKHGMALGESLNVNVEKLANYLDDELIPRRMLSCAFTCRSQDLFLGTPFNWASYAILTHLVAQCCNMAVGELVYTGLDCHIYENQLEAAKEQLERDPDKHKAPSLSLNPYITNINDFTYDDIKIMGYETYPAIKAPLSVG